MGLKGKKEAILEFMRVEAGSGVDTGLLNEIGKSDNHFDKELKDIQPYNQADVIFLQCDLLKSFAEHEESKKPALSQEKLQKKRLDKEKRKLAHKVFIHDLSCIEDELNELRSVDTFHAKARIECKNLASQMFSERFNLSLTNKSRLSQ